MHILFNFEKAYDTICKYGIMIDLHDMDLGGHSPCFVQNIFSERIQGRVGTYPSQIFMTMQKMGG